jgi:hypothetical protein
MLEKVNSPETPISHRLFELVAINVLSSRGVYNPDYRFRSVDLKKLGNDVHISMYDEGGSELNPDVLGRIILDDSERYRHYLLINNGTVLLERHNYGQVEVFPLSIAGEPEQRVLLEELSSLLG